MEISTFKLSLRDWDVNSILNMTAGELDRIEYADAWSTAQCHWQAPHSQAYRCCTQMQPQQLHTPPLSLSLLITTEDEDYDFFI